MKKFTSFIMLALIMLTSSFALTISEDSLPATVTVNFTFEHPVNTTITEVCSSFIAGCSSFPGNGSTTKAYTMTVPSGTNPATYEHFVLATGTNYTEQQNVSVTVSESTQITADNFSINVEKSTTLENYYLVQFFGPNGAAIDFNVGEVGQNTGISGSRTIGENGVDGMYQFFYSPLNNGLFEAEVDFTYDSQTFTKSEQFTVDIYSDLDFTISANIASPAIGETIAFTTNLINFEEPLTFIWDFDNNGASDASTANASYSYPNSGTYTANLTITDKINTVSKLLTITVSELAYTLEILVRDGNQSLNGIEVQVDSSKKATNSTGQVSFSVSDGSHNISIIKEGYVNHTTAINVNADTKYTANLDIDESLLEPVFEVITSEDIRLTTPEDASEFKTDDRLTFTYLVSNTNVASCEVQASFQDNGFVTLASQGSIPPSTQMSVEQEDLTPGSYEWRVKCRDSQNNEATSSTSTFTIVNPRVNLLSQEREKHSSSLEVLSTAITEYRATANPGAKYVIDMLGLEESAYRKKEDLTAHLNSIESIDVNLEETSFSQKIASVDSKIAALLEDAVTKVTILDSSEFVYLPSTKDIETIVEHYVAHNVVEDFSAEKYADVAKDLQKEVSIATKIYLAQLDYANGEKSYYTFVNREITTGDLENITYVELIPDQYVADANEVVFLDAGVETLSFTSPVLFEKGDVSTVNYYIKKQLFTSDVEKFRAALLHPVTSNTSNLFLILLIIGGLAGLGGVAFGLKYLGPVHVKKVPLRVYESARKAVERFSKKKHPVHLTETQLDRIDTIIEQVYALAYMGDEAKSSQLYAQIEGLYQELEEPQKPHVDEKLSNLKHRLIVLHIKSSMEKALTLAKENVFQEAQGLYAEIVQLYAHLPAQYRTQVYGDITNLKNQITILYNMGGATQA